MPVLTRSTGPVDVEADDSTLPATKKAALRELRILVSLADTSFHASHAIHANHVTQTRQFEGRGRTIDDLLEQLRNSAAANARLDTDHFEEERKLARHWQNRDRVQTETIEHLNGAIESLERSRVLDAQHIQILQNQVLQPQIRAHDQELGMDVLGLGNFIGAMTEVDTLDEEKKELEGKIKELEEKNKKLEEEKKSPEGLNRQALLYAAEQELDKEELEKEKSSWTLEKAQMMAKMARMEAEAHASNVVVAQLKADNEAHKAAALKSTADIALSSIRTWDAQARNFTAMDDAKLSLKDEVVFEVMADGFRKRRAEEREQEREQERASKRRCL
jgi:DNA repair exonuclease SbcCD ATPase subunit